MTNSEEIPPRREQVEIVASYSGKINVGRFEQETPFFSVKEVWSGLSDVEIESRQKALNEMCYTRFCEADQKAMVDKIVQQRKDMRFYQSEGMQLPSVTSIITWDDDFFVTPNALSQYAARGTAIHKQIEIFITTKQWLEVKDIPEVYPEYIIVMKGDLGLKFDDVDFRAFYAKHPFEVIKTEQTVFNLKDKYAGRTDIVGIFNGKKSIIDFKTGTSINQEKAFKQLAAYSKCIEGVEQMVVVHLNNKTKQGFSQPIVSNEIEKYFQLFLKDRKAFSERFGV